MDGDENVRESTIQIGRSEFNTNSRFSSQQNNECIQVKHCSILKTEISEEPKKSEGFEESMGSSLERDSKASLQNSNNDVMESLFTNNLRRLVSGE